MSTFDANLNSLYSELSKCEANEDYERALKVSDKVLRKAPEDEIAFNCKVICLIQLSKFKEALSHLQTNQKLSENLVLEKAYCYYRLNNPENALSVIECCKEPSLVIKELEAQILYRLERYDKCFEIYRKVIKHTHDEYEDERAANFTAVITYITSEKPNKEFPSIPERTYELLYNSACCLVEKKRYAEAENKLQEAEKLCREVLEEDGSAEEDIFEETVAIRGQRAYCLQMMGNEQDAQKIYSSILRKKPKDIGLIAITSNNSMAINEEQNIFDMKKKLRSFTVEGLEYKLTSKQNATILFNQCLFALSTNQNSQCLQLCGKLKEKYQLMEENAILVEALLLSRQKKTDEAVKLLLNYTKDSLPSDQLKVKLTAAQILISQNNKKAACEVLENLGESIYKPGIISTLVTLYNSLNESEKSSKFLEEAVEWYIKNKKENVDISPLWRQIADFHLQGGDPKMAAKCLQELRKLKPEDNKIIAKLVIAYAQFDEKKASEYSKQLPQLETEDINVETVLRSNWTTHTKLKKALAKVETLQHATKSAAEELIVKDKKKKRKRKPKLPKNYDPDAEPDPNRWLPKHERVSVKKKRDRRIKDTGIGKGTQGTASGSSDQYDITKMASQSKSNTQNAVQNGPRHQQQRGRVQHKKKKKGR